MVDRRRLRALLERVQEETSGLRELGSVPAEELLGDAVALDAAKYRLVIAVEACIDAGEHIISSERLRTPKSFADVFLVLGEAGFVPKELVPALEEMAKFRNLLVHVYAEVDDRRVVEILGTRLGDFDAFRAAIARTALG